MSLSVVRRSDTLARNPQKVGIEFAVRILVVECRYCISARRDPRKLADCPVISNCGIDVRKGLCAVFWKAVGGGIERADHLAFVITQPFDLHMNYIWLRTHGLWQASVNERGESCEMRKKSPNVSHRRLPT